jgi:hypothetical protein
MSPRYYRRRQLDTSLKLKEYQHENDGINRVDQIAGGGSTVCDRIVRMREMLQGIEVLEVNRYISSA